MLIAIGGKCNPVFIASAAVVLNASLTGHAARFWMATNGCLIVRAFALLISVGWFQADTRDIGCMTTTW